MKTVLQNPGSDLCTVVAVEDGKLITGSVQACDPYIENAARLRADGGGKKDKDIWHAAHFPEVVVEKYCNTAGITFAEFIQNREHVRRMIQDPALAAFRIVGGRL
jgi:hypothetical protein